ncbi:MAG TPA: universal stress protein [Solirubrobacteraceae bacterium]|jgi:nucleotide-binding universal stress UspA family protein|nr:universal stress protein [Solirubrobacteraceae bacterium]
MVLGYDRSESSCHAARRAAGELASGGKLVLVYACRPQHMPPSPLSTAGERHESGRAILDELMLDGDDALFDIDLVTQVSDQDPAAALIDAAQRHDARAIVLGAKPHSRLHEALGTSRPSCCRPRRCRSSRCRRASQVSGPTLRSPSRQSRAPERERHWCCPGNDAGTSRTWSHK